MTRKKFIPGFLAGLLVTLLMLTVRVIDPNPISTLRGAGFDTLQRIWPRSTKLPTPVRIVDIDEASLKALGQWPWPRTEIAKLIGTLHDLGAAAIALDIIFAEADRMSPEALARDEKVKAALGANAAALASLPSNDDALEKSIAASPVITAFATSTGEMTDAPPTKAGFAQTGLPATDAPPKLSKLTHNLKQLDDAAAGTGSINIDLANNQGIARQIPLLWSDGKSFYPSLALETLRVAQGADTYVVNGSDKIENAIESIRVGNIEIPVSESGQFSVYYSHDAPNLYVSAARLLGGMEKEKLAPLISGHLVLIGTSAVGLLDTRTSPLGEAIPGVSVHAQALQQILSGAFLSRPEWAAGGELLVVGLTGLLISIGTTLVRPLHLLAGAASVGSLYAFSVAFAFRQHGLLLDFTFPFLAVATIFLATIAFRLLVTDREGRILRNGFSHYVAPSILAEIENNPASLRLGGETRDVTVLFVDIQNFTPISELVPPERLITFINEILSTCSNAILQQGGTIDKYIGDAVMAFWNAPLATPDHQYHAACACLAIRKNLKAFNEKPDVKALLQAIGQWPIMVRMGLASGPAVVGNTGSLERFDYSVLGETVNLAARAEGICKTVGHDIVFAGKLESKTSMMATLYAGAVRLRGTSTKTRIYVLMGDETYAASDEFKSFTAHHSNIIESFSHPVTKATSRLALCKAAAIEFPATSAYFNSLTNRSEDFSNT